MRFNTKELAYYASTRFGKADKEGALWMKEYEGLIKKKESELYTHFGKFVLLPNLSAYTQRWFLLTGNLLFYCRDEHPVSPPPPTVMSTGPCVCFSMQDSMVVGLIIVEKCRVEVESTEGNRNGFRLCKSVWVCVVLTVVPSSPSPPMQCLMKMVLGIHLWPTLPRSRMSGEQPSPPRGG